MTDLKTRRAGNLALVLALSAAGFMFLILGSAPGWASTPASPATSGRPAAPSQTRSLSASAQDPGCLAGRDNHGSDLCAQWKAADASADASRWSYWTMIAGFLGLVLGIGTLFAAWRAAHWAKAAANHTEAGAKAAQSANKIASDVADRQLRAYLFPSLGEMVLTASDAIASCPIRIAFKNTGATPATLLSYEIRTGVRSQLRQHQTGFETADINKVETRLAKIVGPANETYLSISGHVELRMFSALHVGLAGGTSRAVEFNAVITYVYADYRDRRWRVDAEFTTDPFNWSGKGKRTVSMRQRSAKETLLS